MWDTSIIEARGLSENKYTERLLKEIKDNNWEQLAGGDATAWANASHHYAVQALIPNGAMITPEYVAKESKIVDQQLALAGLRMARVLNRILGEPAAPTASETEPNHVVARP